MISAHIQTNAASGAPARSALVRLALACALALAGIGAAHAERGHGGQYRDDAQVQQGPQQGPQQGARPERYQPVQHDDGAREQRFDPRSFDSREFDDVRARRQQMQQEQNKQEQNMRNAEAGRRSRMTPDERRDLRRQINEANIDLYQNRPQR
jgi:hypothetical protein